MSTTIDSLAIEIQSNSSGAIGDIERLAGALEKIKKSTVTKTAVQNLKSLTGALKELTPVSSNANKLGALAKSLKELTEVGSLRGLTNQLRELPGALRGIADVKLDGVKPQLESVAAALKPLAEVKGKGFNDAMTGLTKLGDVAKKMDHDAIDSFVSKIKELDDKLEPVSKKLIAVGNAIKNVNVTAKTATSSVGGLGGKVNTTALNISSLVTISQSLISTLRPLITLISNSIGTALEWDGVSARFARGFGEQAQDTYAWIQRLNKEMSINIQQFMQYSSIYATMLQGFGVGAKDASEMALGYTELTYDIWAGYNDIYKSYADAADAVRSAISGEVEPVRRAGFTIVDSQLAITAANHGVEYSTQKATEAQKSYLRYLTLVDQAYAQNLVGTYAKEMNTAEGVMRTFRQQLNTLSQTFGSVFLPVLVKIMPYVQAFVELLGEAIITVANFFGVEIQKVDFGSNGFNDLADSANSANNEIQKAEQAAKDLKTATLGFDELNVISPPDANIGGSGSSAGGSAWDELDVGSLWDESIFNNIKSQVDEIKEKIKDWMPVIETVGIALGLLGAAKLLSDLDVALGKMDSLSRAIFGVGTALIEATLVFVFANNYLEDGNLLNLVGEAVSTAIGSYMLYKTWGAKGLVVGIAVSIAAQLVAITLNLANGGVKIDDIELWIQSAFTTATGAIGGGLILKQVFSTMPHALGKGMVFGALAALSLTLAAITIGSAADGDLGLTEAITGILSTVAGGVAGAALVSFLGIATGGTGFLIGAAVMLAANVIGIAVAANVGVREKMATDIAKIFAGSGELALDDVSVEIGVKLSAITDDFGDFEQYRGIIDGTKKSIQNVTTEIDNMAGAIAKDSDAFEEYVPKIIKSVATLEHETKAKLEAIRNNLISALAGGLGEGYHNVGDYVLVVNKIIDDTMTQMDKLEVILKDTAKMGTQEWTDAWSEYKTLIGEATNMTEDFSGMVGSIDWSALTADDGTLDSGALKTYFSDISTAMGDTKNKIKTYYSGIDSDLRQLRENAVKLYGEGSDPVVKLDSLIDTNKQNWDNALGEVNTIAQNAFNELQRDVVFKASDVVTKAQAEYKNLSWWDRLMYPTEASYVQSALGKFKTDYVDPISTEMSGVFEELGINGETWAGDAMLRITNGMFETTTTFNDSGFSTSVTNYKNSMAWSIIQALKDAGQDAKPFALQVAKNVGLDLGNGLGDQYSLIYDKTTGAVTGIKDATTNTVTEMTPDLKAAMEELGIDLSAGVIAGAESEMQENKKRWYDWAIWPWNWFKDENEIHSPSKLFQRGGKYLTDGLANGMSLNSLRDKLSDIWSTAKSWWDNKKGNLKSYTPSIGSIKDMLSNAWTSAKNWWNNNVSLSIPSLSLKVTYSEATGWRKAVVDALGLEGWPSLKFAANGGVFDTGSLIWAGERGAEIVANAGGGKTGVMNVQQMSEAVYEGVYSAVIAAMRDGGGNGGGAQPVNVYLDGKQITASVEKHQRSRGATLMTGGMAYGY